MIIYFQQGKKPATAGHFRVVCLPNTPSFVEVEVTDTDALGTQTKRWTKASGFDVVQTCAVLRDALLRVSNRHESNQPFETDLGLREG